MYAHCPRCETVFAITAAHLRAAHGEVQCGQCEQVFDVLPCLTDTPERRALPDDAGIAPRPGAGSAPGAAGDVTGDGAIEGMDGAEVLGTNQIDASAASGDLASGPVPAALLEDLGRSPDATARSRRGTPRLGLLSALALVLALGAQYAWFAPNDLVSRYPQARGFMERTCALTGCRLGDGRDPQSMRVVTRAVRVHPRFEGALRVQAMVVNTALRPQPYPRVRFSLFNVNGQTIGSRVFDPGEYLGVEPKPGDLLAPGTRVQIALDLVAPDEVAVSYEFRFL